VSDIPIFSDEVFAQWDEMVADVVDRYRPREDGGLNLDAWESTVQLAGNDSLAAAAIIHLLIHRAALYSEQ